MTTPLDALPPLPEPVSYRIPEAKFEPFFGADQMHAYLLADRAARQPAPSPAAQAQKRSLPAELLDRIESALQRHLNDHAPKRIPADPSDTDLVLHYLRQWRQGKSPGWWAPQPPQGGSA